jgi:hypothetical protein
MLVLAALLLQACSSRTGLHPGIGLRISVTNADEMTLDASSLWLTTGSGLVRIDPGDGKVEATLDLRGAGHGIVFANGRIWLPSSRPLAPNSSGAPTTPTHDRVLTEVNPKTVRVTASLPYGRGGPRDIAVDADSIWLIVDHLNDDIPDKDGALIRIDPVAKKVTTTIPIKGVPLSVATGFGAVWVVTSIVGADRGRLQRFDPLTSREVASVDIPRASEVAIGETSVWVSTGDKDGAVVQIDPATNTIVSRIDIADPGAIVATGPFVWVAQRKAPTLTWINARSRKIGGAVRLLEVPRQLVAAPGSVSVVGLNEILRVDY